MKALLWILLYSRLASFVDAVKASGRRRAIAGGDTTTLFPYFTLLSDTTTGAGAKRCSGALIHEDIVVTSADCIYDQFTFPGITPIVARADYQSDKFATSIHFVDMVVNHPMFSPNSQPLSNDIAILRLNSTASKIELPQFTNLGLPTDNGDALEVLGAGPIRNGSTTNAASLGRADVFSTNFNGCTNLYKAAGMGELGEGQFCAGASGAVGPCGLGDRGGPVIDQQGSKDVSEHLLLGIASFGQGCAASSAPYVYTRTENYYEWLRLQICKFSSSPPKYCITAAPSVAPSAAPSINPTRFLEHPYFVLLTDTPTGTGKVRCGGVLVHSDIVLTAASCSSQVFYARVGYNEANSDPIALRTFMEGRSHPDYRGATSAGHYPNNVALLRLSTPVDNVKPIAINAILAVPPDNGAPVSFIGAGDVTSTDGSVLYHEMSVSEDIVTNNFRLCAKDYKDMGISLNEGVQFCAGDGVGGPCGTGDFGGPLVVANAAPDGGDLLVGLASPPGQGCGAKDPPSTFTRIATYALWINQTICFLSALGPDRCITESPTSSPSDSPTKVPTERPTPAPTTKSPTLPPTPLPTTKSPVAPTLAPVTSAPTDRCSDQPNDVLFVVLNGESTLQPCSWLVDATITEYCAFDHSSSAATFCPETCGICTKIPTAAPALDPTPTLGGGAVSPTPGPVSPTPGPASPTPGPVSPTPGPVSPTPAPIVPTPDVSCSDEPGDFLFAVVNGVSTLQPCSWLGPDTIAVFCSDDHSSSAATRCPASCGRCKTEIQTKAPVSSPTLAPSGSSFPSSTPSSIPSIMTNAPSVCEDSETDEIFVSFLDPSDSMRSCAFLRAFPGLNNTLCQPEDPSGAISTCVKTCGGC